MGGDRDGNPNVTPEITRQVSLMSRWVAATLFEKDIRDLRSELSLQVATPELMELSGNVREPYREVLLLLRKRLEATVDWSNSQLTGAARSTSEEPMLDSRELIDPLMKIHTSLVKCGYAQVNHELITALLYFPIIKVFIDLNVRSRMVF
jgi:phosphoenolpyruvate carboxylase